MNELAEAEGPSNGKSALIISCDSHVGPLVREQLRDYCPGKYVADFDRFADLVDAARPHQPGERLRRGEMEGPVQWNRNACTTGGWDPYVRLREMDADGVAASVIFQGLAGNGICDPVPFNGPFGAHAAGYSSELVRAGARMYNRWLADFVSVSPGRHLGLALIAVDDVDLAVKEVEWARGAGLIGVNLPRQRPDLPPYNAPQWDRLWSACEDLGMTMHTHAQSPEVLYKRPGDIGRLAEPQREL